MGPRAGVKPSAPPTDAGSNKNDAYERQYEHEFNRESEDPARKKEKDSTNN